MSPFALIGPFQSRNNLFRPRFNSIDLKWKFFNYLTFFFFGAWFSKITIHLTVLIKYITDRKRNLLFMKTVNSGSYSTGQWSHRT